MWIKTADEMYINSDNVIGFEWTRVTNQSIEYKHALLASFVNHSNAQVIVQCKTDEEKMIIDEKLHDSLIYGGIMYIPKF